MSGSWPTFATRCACRADGMQRAGRHLFSPRAPLVVHADEQAFATDGSVVLRAGAVGVEMAMGHVVFVPDFAGLENGDAPKQTALFAGRNRGPPADTVDFLIRIEEGKRGLIGEDCLQVRQIL